MGALVKEIQVPWKLIPNPVSSNFSMRTDEWMLPTRRQYQERQSLTEGLTHEQSQDTWIWNIKFCIKNSYCRLASELSSGWKESWRGRRGGIRDTPLSFWQLETFLNKQHLRKRMKGQTSREGNQWVQLSGSPSVSYRKLLILKAGSLKFLLTISQNRSPRHLCLCPDAWHLS